MTLSQKNYDPAVMAGAVDDVTEVPLASAKILVGNGSGIAAPVDLSGDAVIANTGALTISDGKVTIAKTNFITSPSASVAAKSATGNVASGDMGKNITNTGASGAIVLTLLAAATAGISTFRVYATVAQTITLTPQTGAKIYLAGSGVASKYLLIAGIIGNYVDVFCDGTDYHVVNYSGVVTKQA